MAAIRMENYGVAIQDAEAAIDLDPNYLKAFYRRGSANYALGKVGRETQKRACLVSPSHPPLVFLVRRPF